MKIIEKAILSLMVLIFSIYTPYCQERCGTDMILEELGRERPTLLQEYEKSFRDFYQHSIRSMGELDCPIIIPVHVIILHRPDDDIGEGTNLSEERILSQIAVLNEDFSRTNSDKDQTPPEFNVGDTGIKFYMASIDPAGKPTSGITRYPITQNYNIGESSTIRNIRTSINEKTGWDREIYLNIWVAPTLDVLGFAKVPTQTFLPKWNDDGAYMHSDVFGGPGYATRENYDQGRTLTHEVGHFLGLGHIWRSNGCTLDDGIADTPLQNSANYNCPTHPSYSCGNEGDMFMNYMDYTHDACVNAFTIDQGAYMRTILNTSRAELLTAAGFACPDKLIIEMQTISSINPSCHGGNDGIIEVSACGGANNDYKYAIDGGTYSTSNVFTDLTAGIHTISVKNLFGIEGKIEVELLDPEPGFINGIETRSPLCYGTNTGSIFISPDNSTQLTYSLDGINFSDKNSFENLSAGTYHIYIKSPMNCIQHFKVDIAPPNNLEISVDEMKTPTCHGYQDGKIILSAKGGALPYSYSIDGIHYQNEPFFDNLFSGIYTIQVKDNNNCVFSVDHILLEPNELKINLTEINSIKCFGNNNGELSINTQGGVGEVLMSFDNGPYSINHSYKNLSSGNFRIRAEDENGCSAEVNYELKEPEPLTIAKVTVKDVLCVGDENGDIRIDVSGGTPDYKYTLNSQYQSDKVFNNLDVGIYTITVLDKNNCIAESQTEIKTQSDITMDILEVYAPNCYGEENGKALVKAQGGKGEYSYSLDNKNFKPDPFFSNLKSGKSLIYIKDENSCMAAAPIEIPGAPKIEIINLEIDNPTCETNKDGFISISAKGGHGSLKTKINGTDYESDEFDNLENGNYFIEIVDENFCRRDTLVVLESPQAINIELVSISETNCEFNLLGTASFGANGGNNDLRFRIGDQENDNGVFQNLGGGKKKLIVYDEIGCLSEFEFEIPVVGGLTINLDRMIQPKCFNSNDGSIRVNATGGQNNYSFSTGNTTNFDGLFGSLYGGIHKIIATDHFGCIGELALQLDTPKKLVLDTVYLREPVCYNQKNGIIDADVVGGKSPIIYSLDNHVNYSGVFTGLYAGVYAIKMVDVNGCELIENITLNEPEKIKATNIELLSPKCHGDENGKISFDVNGGIGSKLIYYKDQIFDTSLELSGLSAGNYRVRMSDQNKCNELLDIFLEEPADLISNDTIVFPETYQSLGELSVTYSGGTKPYLFALNNGEYISENTFANLVAGEYSFHVVDAHNCKDEINVTVPYDDSFENPDGSVSNIWVSHNSFNQNHLHFKLHGDQHITYKIFSIDGKIVYSSNLELMSGEHKVELPISQFSSGSYLLRFNAERDYKNLKFIKF